MKKTNRKSMPTVDPPEGCAVGQVLTIRIPPATTRYNGVPTPVPARIIRVVVRRFARNTYFTTSPKGAVMIEHAPNCYYPFSYVVK